MRLSVVADRWEPGAAFSYQWLRAGTPIVGANAASYVLTAADRGTQLAVRVLGAKDGKVAVSRDSSATATVSLGKLSTSRPALRGKAIRGKMLRVAAGKWDGATLTYRWYRGTKLVRTTSKPAYKLGKADIGKRIRVTVKGSKAGYKTVERGSKRTAKVRR